MRNIKDVALLVAFKTVMIGLFLSAVTNSSSAFGAGLDFLPQVETKTVTKRLSKTELVALTKGNNPVCIKMFGKVEYVNPTWVKLGIKKSACSKNGKTRKDYERTLGVNVIYVDQSNLSTDLLKSILKR